MTKPNIAERTSLLINLALRFSAKIYITQREFVKRSFLLIHSCKKGLRFILSGFPPFSITDATSQQGLYTRWLLTYGKLGGDLFKFMWLI